MTRLCCSRFLACIALYLASFSLAHQHRPRRHASFDNQRPARAIRKPLGFTKFDAHFVINLEKRKDRLARVLSMLQSINVTDPTIVRAVPHGTCGILGCGLSWILALQECSDTNGTTCMIMEDDFDLAMSPNKAARRVDALFASGVQWDVVMLSGRTINSSDAASPFLRRVHEARTTSGLAIARAYAKTLLKNVVRGVSRLNKNCTDDTYMIDVYMNELVKSGGRWYIFHPLLGYQRPSFSDIQNEYTNYTSIVGQLVK